MGRTNVVLDDKLVSECQKATKIKTRRALIDHALQELLRHERQKKILELKGKVPESWFEAWKGVKVEAYLNDADMREFRIEG